MQCFIDDKIFITRQRWKIVIPSVFDLRLKPTNSEHEHQRDSVCLGNVFRHFLARFHSSSFWKVVVSPWNKSILHVFRETFDVFRGNWRKWLKNHWFRNNVQKKCHNHWFDCLIQICYIRDCQNQRYILLKVPLFDIICSSSKRQFDE